MKRVFLSILVFSDLVVIAVLSFLLYQRLTHAPMSLGAGRGRMFGTPFVSPHSPLTPPSSKTSVIPGGSSGVAINPRAMPVLLERNMAFAYRNSRARHVFFRADFTGWKPVPMARKGKNLWIYTKVLTPGEYAYCFTVDGRSIRDPANKRVKDINGIPVSAVVVTSPAPPHKTNP